MIRRRAGRQAKDCSKGRVKRALFCVSLATHTYAPVEFAKDVPDDRIGRSLQQWQS